MAIPLVQLQDQPITAAGAHSISSQWARKAQFVAIRVDQVEEPFTPFRIAQRRLGPVPFSHDVGVEAPFGSSISPDIH